MGTKLPVFYNCAKCPGFCCTYPVIQLTPFDIKRLAKRFGISPKACREKYTKPDGEGGRMMRHRQDDHFQTACQFLDIHTRRCTVYEHRPGPCRAYPGAVRCGYYDFLAAERDRQEDKDLVISAWIAE